MAKQVNDGGPAFGAHIQFSSLGNCANSTATVTGTLSRRDYFAAAALSNYDIDSYIDGDKRHSDAYQKDGWPIWAGMAHDCYAIADAMIAASEEQPVAIEGPKGGEGR